MQREQLAADGAGHEHLAAEGAEREGLAADGARREHLAADGARRERPGVARARRVRGPAHAPLRAGRLMRQAQAAMELLRLLALTMMALQPGVAGGAETVGNSSVGKVGGASLLQSSYFLIYSKVRIHSGARLPSGRGGEFRPERIRVLSCRSNLPLLKRPYSQPPNLG